MAKKTSAKKTTSKKTVKKSASSSTKSPAKKSPAKKAAAKKSTKKVTSAKAPKKAPAKKTTKATAASKTAAKKTTKKPAAPKKAAAKPAPASKAASKKTPTKKAPTKKTSKKAAESKTSPKAETSAKSAGKADTKKNADDQKSGRKGITIVSKKAPRRSKPKTEVSAFMPAVSPLLGPGLKRRAPLIPSGPKNTVARDTDDLVDETDGKKRKSPFNKRKLDRFKEVLITKRRVLVDELNNLENQALKSETGSLSNLPQHSAEQGSDTTEQSISLGMADADRQLIREIDAALERIADGTFGLCVQTGRPISEDRLEELPWARLSIEAARANDRGFRR